MSVGEQRQCCCVCFACGYHDSIVRVRYIASGHHGMPLSLFSFAPNTQAHIHALFLFPRIIIIILLLLYYSRSPHEDRAGTNLRVQMRLLNWPTPCGRGTVPLTQAGVGSGLQAKEELARTMFPDIQLPIHSRRKSLDVQKILSV
jgi:hypothetical protein